VNKITEIMIDRLTIECEIEGTLPHSYGRTILFRLAVHLCNLYGVGYLCGTSGSIEMTEVAAAIPAALPVQNAA
jgi:hypothetical protein